MDYTQLAVEFMQKMHLLRKAKMQKKFTESMHGEMFVLQHIALHKGDVQPGEISTEMDISSARIAAVLNSLENKGMIIRKIDNCDRRRILVELTQAGKELANKHHSAIMEETAMMLRQLGENDANEFLRIIGRLTEMVSEHKNCNNKI